MLRVATAGSVDDGKSTLIGRLLHDSKSLMADELGTAADLARLTDGLRAEREQGITIDVAYRHFATPNRRFVLHDCPGHAQYTRNMATGASTADLALVLVDARRGMTEQSRRHLAIAALLGVPNVTVLRQQDGPRRLRRGALRRRRARGARLVRRGSACTASASSRCRALHGDNVVDRSAAMPWYGGESLLEHLESVPAANGVADGPARLPVQYVIRADGDALVRRPPRRRHAARGRRAGRPALRHSARAWPPSRTAATSPPPPARSPSRSPTSSTSAAATCSPARPRRPEPVRELTATLCWLGDEPARPGARYLIKHTTRSVPARLDAIEHRLDVTTLGNEPADELALNEIGRVRLRLGAPLVPDPYEQVRATGAFIVVDAATNDTVGAGMVA